MLYDYRIGMSYHMPYDCDVDNCTVKCDFVLLYTIGLSYKEGGMQDPYILLLCMAIWAIGVVYVIAPPT